LVLERALAAYRPDFLTVDVRDREGAANLDPRWGYRPVAFDWTTVLYAHRQSQRDLVVQYELRAIDPFTAVAGEPGPGAPPDLARAELEQLAAVDTYNGAVAVALARLQLAADDPADALSNAQHATTTTPLHAEGWLAAGDANLALRRYRDAIDSYETARKRGGPEGRIGRQLWVCWTKLREPRRAYRELDRAIDPVASSTTFVDLLALGETAAAVGDHAAAERNLTFALWKAPDGESERRAAAALARIRKESPWQEGK
jgi:tetratricopeptide (TPR) repeat protein